MSSKKQYTQFFKPSYKTLFPVIKDSQKGNTYAFCTICVCDFTISHGGKSDITKHLNTAKHKENASRPATSSKLDGFMKTSEPCFDVIRAECLFTQFLVEHNIPLSASDHAGQLFKKMFPDSNVAKQYACARTKTASIVGTMAEDHQQSMIKILQSSAFSLAVDGSNDTDAKLYPIVVTYFNDEANCIKNNLLSLPSLVGDSTGKNIAKLNVNELDKFGIPVSNLLAFGADNAAVMMGHIKGVAAFLKKLQPELITVGCPCHVINLTAEKVAAALPVNIDKIIIDIYYYFQKSSKRKESLKKFQELHGSEMHKILKHVCTRWLSLGRALSRILEQWDALLSYFHEEVKHANDKHQKPSRGKKRKLDEEPSQSNYEISIISVEENFFYFLSSNLNKAYCFFLLNAIQHFEEHNVKLQSAVPKVPYLRKMLEEFLTGLLVRFIKPTVMKNFTNVLDIPFQDIHNQKSDDDIMIGQSSYDVISEICDDEKDEFYSAVRHYFEAACAYIFKKFPLKEDSLLHAQVADLKNLDKASFANIRYFVKKLPYLLKIESDEDENSAWDLLQKQFAELQCTEIPEEENVDSCIATIAKMRSAGGDFKFNRIARVLKAIVTIPHSNAECERIFSTIKKNLTQFRPSMSTKTVENILLSKSYNENKCFEAQFTPSFLKKAKSATMNSLS